MLKYVWIIFISNFVWSSSHHTEQFLEEMKHDPRATEKIYQQFCANCHAIHPLIPMGAPRVGVIKDWQQRQKKGLSVMLEHTLNGYHLMPARGGCFECSDEQIKMIIDYMLKQ
jgi:cytochrome c5